MEWEADRTKANSHRPDSTVAEPQTTPNERCGRQRPIGILFQANAALHNKHRNIVRTIGMPVKHRQGGLVEDNTTSVKHFSKML
jgi:hypothetical protein